LAVQTTQHAEFSEGRALRSAPQFVWLPGNHLQSADAISDSPAFGVIASETNMAEFFTVVFYGLQIFACKTAQFRVTRCKHNR
jgi:hypothetical protein